MIEEGEAGVIPDSQGSRSSEVQWSGNTRSTSKRIPEKRGRESRLCGKLKKNTKRDPRKNGKNEIRVLVFLEGEEAGRRARIYRERLTESRSCSVGLFFPKQ